MKKSTKNFNNFSEFKNIFSNLSISDIAPNEDLIENMSIEESLIKTLNSGDRISKTDIKYNIFKILTNIDDFNYSLGLITPLNISEIFLLKDSKELYGFVIDEIPEIIEFSINRIKRKNFGDTKLDKIKKFTRQVLLNLHKDTDYIMSEKFIGIVPIIENIIDWELIDKTVNFDINQPQKIPNYPKGRVIVNKLANEFMQVLDSIDDVIHHQVYRESKFITLKQLYLENGILINNPGMLLVRKIGLNMIENHKNRLLPVQEAVFFPLPKEIIFCALYVPFIIGHIHEMYIMTA